MTIPTDLDAEDVLQEIEELYELIETATEENDRGLDFYEDVKHDAQRMEDWIRKNERATRKQLEAVHNWRDGVKAWIP